MIVGEVIGLCYLLLAYMGKEAREDNEILIILSSLLCTLSTVIG